MNQSVFSNPNTKIIKIPLEGNKTRLVTPKEFARMCGVPEATFRDNVKRLERMIENEMQKISQDSRH